MQQQTYGSDFTVEESSYFIREPIDNPEEASTYRIMNSCTAWNINERARIDCFKESTSKTFQFNLKTGRFTYTYSGSWHEKVKKNYYGDSSLMAFGECKEYYR